jgi:hypothetical protein
VSNQKKSAHKANRLFSHRPRPNVLARVTQGFTLVVFHKRYTGPARTVERCFGADCR